MHYIRLTIEDSTAPGIALSGLSGTVSEIVADYHFHPNVMKTAQITDDRYYVVEHGKVIDGFANSELEANMDKLHTYLGV